MVEGFVVVVVVVVVAVAVAWGPHLTQVLKMGGRVWLVPVDHL